MVRNLLSCHLASLYLCLECFPNGWIEGLVDIHESKRASENDSIECLHALNRVFDAGQQSRGKAQASAVGFEDAFWFHGEDGEADAHE